jgi:hypothetical protein
MWSTLSLSGPYCKDCPTQQIIHSMEGPPLTSATIPRYEKE